MKLDHDFAALSLDVYLSARMKSNQITNLLWNHDLALGADLLSHTERV